MPGRRIIVSPQGRGLQIITASLPLGPISVPYSSPVVAVGSTGTLTWSLPFQTGSNGWVINPATGVVSGTPGTAEIDLLTVSVFDGLLNVATRVISVQIGVPAATPTFSPVAGTYSGAQSVALNCTTPSPSMFYTLDGSTPTTSSTPYVSAITVSASETIKAIATASGFLQSAVGTAAYIINTVGPTNVAKFAPGFTPVSGVLGGIYDGTQVQWQGDAAQLVTNPTKILNPTATGYMPGHAIGSHWRNIEDCTQATFLNNPAAIATQYPGFTQWITYFNFLQAQFPATGAYLMIYFNTHEYTQNFNPTNIVNHDMSQYYPKYLVNGAPTLPNSYGSSLHTAYTLQKPYPTVNSGCAFGLSGYNGTTYPLLMPALWDPAVAQARALMFQAWSQFQFTVTAGPLSGQTFTPDTCPFMHLAGTADEDSISFIPANGDPLNPPQFTNSTNQPTPANYHGNINKLIQVWNVAMPTTPWVPCESFGFQGGGSNGQDTSASMAAVVNANLSPFTGQSTNVPWAFSQADMWQTAFAATSPQASQGQLGFLGIASGTATTTPVPTAQSLQGQQGFVALFEPLDFTFAHGGANNRNAAAVNACIASAMGTALANGKPLSQYINPSMCDDLEARSSWTSYIQPTIAAAAQPSELRPVKWMPVIGGLSGTATASSVTLTWNALTMWMGRNLSYNVYKDGVLAGNSATGTITLSSSGTHLWQIACTNSNGTGALNAGISLIPPSWKTLPVGSGGFVRGLNIAPDGTMVARTDTNGAYLYNGTSWNQLATFQSIPNSLIANDPLGHGPLQFGDGVIEVQVAPSNTNIMYMMLQGYVFVSSNKGTTWTNTAFTRLANMIANNTGGPNGPFGAFGQKIAIDPQNANIVYVGTLTNGLFVTTNGGTTWGTVSGVPSGSGPGVTGILFDPSSSVVGGAKQGIYACSNGGGVYHSTNGGASWTLTSSGPTGVIYAAIDTSGNYYAIPGSTVEKGTGLMKFSSGVWTTTSAPSNGSTLQAVAINPFNISEVVVICAGGQIALSYDAGATWTAINQAFTLSSPDIPWIAAGNFNPGGGFYFLDAGGLAFSATTNGQLILSAGTGVWSTTLPSSGFTGTTPYVWTDMSVGIEQLVANQICVPPVSGASPVLASWDRPFFKITNLAAYPSTYGPVNSSDINVGWSFDYASSNPSVLAGLADVGNSEQSGFSTDDGATWTIFASHPTGTPSSFNGGSMAASTPSNILWAPAQTGAGGTAPSYTTNQGASWTAITLPGVSDYSKFQINNTFNNKSVTADRVNATTFYLYYPNAPAGSASGVFKSTDGGATWSQVFNGNIAPSTFGTIEGFNLVLASVPGNAGHLFYTPGRLVNTSATLTSPLAIPFYRSTNGGVTWTTIPNALQVSCFGFGASGPGQTYPAVYIYGWVNSVLAVWQSVDNCVTWTNLGAFPTGALDAITCISGDPNIFGRVFIGFSGGGYAYI